MAAPMTNDDVIKMVRSGLDEGIILSAIQNSEPKFDATPDGLIGLGEAKVSKTIVTAVISRVAGKSTETKTVEARSGDLMSPSDVILLDGGTETVLQYSKLQVRAAARGLGFGGVASYCVLSGVRSNIRLKNSTPNFLLCIPERAQPNSAVDLVNFAVRKNGSREVMTGGGYASYSTGFPPQRVVAMKFERFEQVRAPKGFVIYRAVPQRALTVGEYAMVMSSDQTVVGLMGLANGSCFDFGIDL
jgi:hypothetical protein